MSVERLGCPRQKAPSAKRCIKTRSPGKRLGCTQDPVRKHRAPKGALRQEGDSSGDQAVSGVRKHRAPKGALRRDSRRCGSRCRECQKAPSAKRCIMTARPGRLHVLPQRVRKHRAPKGALRRVGFAIELTQRRAGQKAPSAKRCIKTCNCALCNMNPSLSRQKAPSAKRCIKTRRFARTVDSGMGLSESTERQKVH